MKSKIGKIVLAIFLIFFLGVIGHEAFLAVSTESKEEKIVTYEEAKNIIALENAKDEAKNEVEEEEVIPEDTHLKISVIGDIMCHNSQYLDAYDLYNADYDFSYAFDDIQEITKDSDIFMGNLETTFAGKEKGYSNYPTFNSPEHLAVDLKELGMDILTTANNHCMDTGYEGLESTLNYLDEAGLAHTGTNRSEEEQNTILVKEVNGIKIAFLAFTYGTNGIKIPKDKTYAVNLLDEDFVLSQIELAKEQKPDIICASVHWGTEYQTSPNKDQQKWADFLIKNGVTIIFGSHPHILQSKEIREVTLDDGNVAKGFVIYSLGNFMSGQTKTGTRTSIVLNIDITKKGQNSAIFIDNISYTPIYTYVGAEPPKYKIMNMEKAVEKFESEEDTSIGKTNYNLFKSEIERVNKLFE